MKTPGDIAGLGLWLDAADADSTEQKNGKVGRWRDKGPHGFAAVQKDAAKQPIYVRDGLSKRGVLRFSGIENLSLGNIGSFFPSAATLFIVAAINNADSYNLLETRANDTWWCFPADGGCHSGVFRAKRAAANTEMPSRGAHVFTVISSARAWEMRIDGVAKGAAPGDFDSGDDYLIGGSPDRYVDLSRGNRSPTRGGLKGDIAEIIIYDHELDKKEIGRIEDYLKEKYDWPAWEVNRSALDVSLAVDFSRPMGKIRPLHGVGNGPSVFSPFAVDLAPRHKEAGFPSVRLHDCHWPNPNVVDIPSIFPLFHADPEDPKNYVFAPTDRYLAPIVENGCQIIYRLGVSIELNLPTFYAHPPHDFQKWAGICVNIIRHYNEGWADGFHYGIKHFEIWNEPQHIYMWSGTEEEYFELYRVAATTLKEYDPSLKVGGPAAFDIGTPMVRRFLAYCRERNLPLDFLSWHSYRPWPAGVVLDAESARSVLDEYGFKETESYLDEWKPMLVSLMWFLSGAGRTPAVKAASARNRNHEAAAFAASLLMQLQDIRVDMAHFYCADDSFTWSMFDEFGIPGKVYFALKAFNRLLDTPNRVTVEGAPGLDAVTACAGMADDRKSAAVLLSNFKGKPGRVAIMFKNLPLAGQVRVERYLVDERHEFEPAGEETLDPATRILNVEMPPATVCLVRLTQK